MVVVVVTGRDSHADPPPFGCGGGCIGMAGRSQVVVPSSVFV